MIFEINKKQAGMDQDVFYKVQYLLQFSLSRYEGTVSQVRVYFFNVKGPNRGEDKRCRVSVKMRTAGQVLVSSEGSNFVEALNNCLGRLVREIRRKIDKQRTKLI